MPSAVSYAWRIETLTFLFTDIEASTALMLRVGDAVFATVLEEHHRLIRESLRAHAGKEEGTQGDSFFAVFTSPSSCVAAAIEMQRSFGDFQWPNGVQLHVRMGIHTGEASEAMTGLVGYEVHRAARIAAVAHGGQVLLSSATAGLVEDSLPPEITLRNLGAHRLKDLGRPEVIFQLVAGGLRSDFAPLRSLDNPELPNNLPASLNPFIGRASELKDVRLLLLESRLVTLTGSGGAGKTRLALQAAAEELDGSGEGVWFVELAPVSDPDHLASAVIEALQMRQEPDRNPTDSLVHSLREQRVLLVLDNCEHIIDAVAKVTDLIGRNCPRVSILATSREPLGVDAELVYRVRSLSLPEGDVEAVGDLDGSDAVQLFVARARARDTTFVVDDAMAPVVATVCRRLDGLPLAIELAAARLSSMSINDLHRRLDQRFRLLTGGSRNALPRQQTLGAMVAWSYDLLNEPEREVLRRLTVFVSGFDLDAAEAVCFASIESFDVADVLGSLVNKSLVSAERTSGTLRYSLLETIRQFAVEQLLQIDGPDAAHEARRLHAEHYLRLVEEAAPNLVGQGQVAWVWRLQAEWDNLLSAFEFFASEPERSEDVLRLGSAGKTFFITRRLREPIKYLDDALRKGPQEPSTLRVSALLTRTWLAQFLIEDRAGVEAQREEFDKIVTLARLLGDEYIQVEALSWLARTTRSLGEDDVANTIATQALSIARRLADPFLVGQAVLALGAPQRGRSEALVVEALEYFRSVGNRSWSIVALLSLSLSGVESLEDVPQARALTEEAITACEDVGANWALYIVWGNMSVWCALMDDVPTALAAARRSIIVSRRLGVALFHELFAVLVLSWCAASRGDAELAAKLLGAHESLRKAMPSEGEIVWTPPEVEFLRTLRDQISAALGPEQAERLCAVGRSLASDEIVDLSLGRKRSPR